jgi:hypothetical protein
MVEEYKHRALCSVFDNRGCNNDSTGTPVVCHYTWDCRRWQPEIIEAANALLGMGDSIDVKMTLQQLAVALGYIGTDMALPILTEMLHSEHCNVGGEMERDIEIAMERIHR